MFEHYCVNSLFHFKLYPNFQIYHKLPFLDNLITFIFTPHLPYYIFCIQITNRPFINQSLRYGELPYLPLVWGVIYTSVKYEHKIVAHGHPFSCSSSTLFIFTSSPSSSRLTRDPNCQISHFVTLLLNHKTKNPTTTYWSSSSFPSFFLLHALLLLKSWTQKLNHQIMVFFFKRALRTKLPY